MEEITRCLKPVFLSVTLIVGRNIPTATRRGTSEELLEKLFKVTHIRLDRENIGNIDNLEVLGPVTNLYLQQNFIKKIENMECMMNLRFLTLSGNQIEVIENLLSLDRLQFLDLSENLIGPNFDSGELPKSLFILNMEKNPCCKLVDYRSRIIESLPILKQLDGQPVVEVDEELDDVQLSSDDEVSREEEEEADVYNEDEEHINTHKSYYKSLDDVLNLSVNLIKQSHDRVKQYRKSHDHHMATIEEARLWSSQAIASPRIKFTPR